jgi:hypothetical protein
MLLKIFLVTAWLAMTIAGSVLQPVKGARSAEIRAEPSMVLRAPDFDRQRHSLTIIDSEEHEKRAGWTCRATVCKAPNNSGKTACFPVNFHRGYWSRSGWRCKNLVSSDGRAFVYSGSRSCSECKVYDQKDCPQWSWSEARNVTLVGAKTRFPFNALSIQCLL